MRRILPVFAALLCAPAVGQIRVVNYNTLDGPTPGVHDNSANMSTIFAGIAAQSVNGIAKPPDLIILQEQTNTSAAALAALLNTQYGLTGAYVAVLPAGQPSSADPVFIDRQAFVYDSTALQLIGSGTSIATGAHRPVIRAQFRPVGYTSAAASFYAYGAHLMASDAPDRSLQTAAMRANSNALGEVHALYAGDFNMQNNQETAWQNMVTGAGAGLAIDPLNPNNNSQTWNNNSAFASIHTQSTRTGATPDNDGGATGGMDDRFDVQISTQEFHDGEGLSYIANSYRAYGQDGQHFNAAINTAPFPLGSTIANALWDASDHLPVVVDYQVPAFAGFQRSLGDTFPARVIRGAGHAISYNVNNSPIRFTNTNMADELDYTLVGAGATSGSLTNTIAAGTYGLHTFQLTTAVSGLHSSSVTFSSTSQGARLPSVPVDVYNYEVLEHATASLQPDVVSTSATIEFGVWGLGAAVPLSEVLVHNLASSLGPTAGMDVDGNVRFESNAFTFAIPVGASLANIPAGSSRTGTVSFSTTSLGTFYTGYIVLCSDQNLLGATSSPYLTLNLVGTVAMPGDCDLNNTVNISDFAILAGNFNESSQMWQDGDFNRDGSVNIADFAVLAGNFNQSAPRTNVPEPCGLLAAAIVILRYSEGSSRLRKRRRPFGVPQDYNGTETDRGHHES